jgi:hypothetical protein
MSEQKPLEFEHEKWLADHELRKREIALKEREASRSRWSSPLAIAIFAAAAAGIGNAAATWLTGVQQRRLESEKSEQVQRIEETKAEGARILQMITTGDPDKAAVNLKFLLDAGLISDADRRKNIQAFLDNRAAGQGPTLPQVLKDWQDIQRMGAELSKTLNEQANTAARNIR